MQQQTASRLYPYCNVCGWRKGGVDSWNATACKCGYHAQPFAVTAAVGAVDSRNSFPVGALDDNDLDAADASELDDRRPDC